MPRYDIRNDGVGPYATFYCDKCYREFRSQPDLGNTVAGGIGRAALGGLLRNVPVVGWAAANSMEDPRYSNHMNPQQLEGAWNQVAEHFHECPTCRMIVCPSDWDAQAGYCNEDSPRREQIAQAQTEQAMGVAKGIASAFGLGAAINNLGQSMQQAAALVPRCSKCGTPARAGVKFCPQCGGQVVQPNVPTCPSCHKPNAPGTAFCVDCGTPLAATAQPQPTTCPKCGATVAGKFCGACGSKVG
jgi:hypothetical protein